MKRETLTSVGWFLATLLCVYWVYGSQWTDGGSPFSDPRVARESATFAVALMAILGAHEMGHFLVARRHGFELSLPTFIPFPMAFGTFGAIIRLRSLPKSRTGLLEMGAAGPLAGAVVALLALAFGLPGTGPPPELSLPPPVPVESTLSIPEWVLLPLAWLDSLLAPEVPDGHALVLIFNNPPVMDLLGWLILGHVPGRFDTLTPLAMAGWVGCLLTAINLVPIGQLDGGHIFNAILPGWSDRVSRIMLGLALGVGLFTWFGWTFWALLLLFTGAFRGLPVPPDPPLTPRARLVALLALLAFGLTFMPIPVEFDSMPIDLEASGQVAP